MKIGEMLLSQDLKLKPYVKVIQIYRVDKVTLYRSLNKSAKQ